MVSCRHVSPTWTWKPDVPQASSSGLRTALARISLQTMVTDDHEEQVVLDLARGHQLTNGVRHSTSAGGCFLCPAKGACYGRRPTSKQKRVENAADASVFTACPQFVPAHVSVLQWAGLGIAGLEELKRRCSSIGDSKWSRHVACGGSWFAHCFSFRASCQSLIGGQGAFHQVVIPNLHPSMRLIVLLTWRKFEVVAYPFLCWGTVQLNALQGVPNPFKSGKDQ